MPFSMHHLSMAGVAVVADSCSMHTPSKRSRACVFTSPDLVTSVIPNLTIMDPAVLMIDSMDLDLSASSAIHVRKFLNDSTLCLGSRSASPSKISPRPRAYLSSSCW